MEGSRADADSKVSQQCGHRRIQPVLDVLSALKE